MSAWELKRDHTTRYCLFAIDSNSDLYMLPTSKRVGKGDVKTSTFCAIGSMAKAVNGKWYMLNGNDEWVEYVGGSGGGGGGGDDHMAEDSPIPDDTIEGLFDGSDSGEPGPQEDTNRISDETIESLFG